MKNIVVPSRRIYPLDKMRVGETFTIQYSRNLYQSLRGAVRYWRVNHSGDFFDVIANKNSGLIRCTKISKEQHENKYLSNKIQNFQSDNHAVTANL